MSISKNRSRSEKLDLLGERYLGESLISEAALHEFLSALPVTDWEMFAARMQVIVDVTTTLIENESDETEESDLELIKQVASESKDKGYRQIVGAIVAAIEQGEKGIKLSHQTASVAIDMVFIWTPEYFAALRHYAGKLRRMRQKAKSRGR